MITKEETIATDLSTNVDPPVTGSPIIIGGGGAVGNKVVRCTFKEGDYIDQSSGLRTKFVVSDPAQHLKTLKLTIDQKLTDLSSFVPATGDGEIEIRCPGFNNDLKIFGNPLAVEFDTRTYREKPKNPDQKRVFEDDDSVVSKVKIEFPGFKLERKLTRNEALEIEVNFA